MIAEERTCRRGHTGQSRQCVRPDSGGLFWRCRVCDRAAKSRYRAKRIGPTKERISATDWPAGYHHQPAPRVRWVVEGYIFNDRIRDAVLGAMRRDPDLAPVEIAARCGWTNASRNRWVCGDDTRLLRALGIRLYYDKKARGGFTYRQTIREEDALAVLRAIHVDPWEVGL